MRNSKKAPPPPAPLTRGLVFGAAGLLGLLGFWVYPQTGEVFPFAFFLFLGFFGFFFEGKMSHTLMDERYTEPRQSAADGAKTALSIIFVAVILLAQAAAGTRC